jgi:hypothetical protein
MPALSINQIGIVNAAKPAPIRAAAAIIAVFAPVPAMFRRRPSMICASAWA